MTPGELIYFDFMLGIIIIQLFIVIEEKRG